MARLLQNASLVRGSLMPKMQEYRSGVSEAFTQIHNFSTKGKKNSKSESRDSHEQIMSKKDLALKVAMDKIKASFGEGSIRWLGRPVPLTSSTVVSGEDKQNMKSESNNSDEENMPGKDSALKIARKKTKSSRNRSFKLSDWLPFPRNIVVVSDEDKHYSNSESNNSGEENMHTKDLALKLASDQTAASEKGFMKGLGHSVFPRNAQVVSTGLFALDVALEIGGLQKGRAVEIYGPDASGKTTIALHVIAEAQKLGGYCAFVDAEHSLDKALTKSIGVNDEKLLVTHPDCGEQALNLVDNLIQSGKIDVVVVDNVKALVPKIAVDGELGKAHIALQAKLMKEALHKLSHSLSHSQTLLIFTSHVRIKLSTFGFSRNGLNSVCLHVRRTAVITRRKETIGTKVLVSVVGDKHAPTCKTAEFKLELGKGFCREDELIDLGCKHKLITKKGAIFDLDGRNHHSKDALKRFLSVNESIREELMKALRGKLFNTESDQKSNRS